jgi:predicted RecB family nuclease
MSKKKKPVKILKEKEESKLPPPEPSEKPFDFGGIPSWNLKKNLGCG